LPLPDLNYGLFPGFPPFLDRLLLLGFKLGLLLLQSLPGLGLLPLADLIGFPCEDILQRLGAFHPEQDLIVDADPVGRLGSLLPELGDLRLISRPLGEGQLPDLGVQLPQLPLLLVQLRHILPVLPDLTALQIRLRDPLKGIGQKRAVGNRLRVPVLVQCILAQVALRSGGVPIVLQYILRKNVRKILIDSIKQIGYTNFRIGNGALKPWAH